MKCDVLKVPYLVWPDIGTRTDESDLSLSLLGPTNVLSIHPLWITYEVSLTT